MEETQTRGHGDFAKDIESQLCHRATSFPLSHLTINMLMLHLKIQD